MSGCDRRDHFEEKANDRCCGTCKYHEYEKASQGWVCVNDKSDFLSDWTEYGDYCEEWEMKGDRAE